MLNLFISVFIFMPFIMLDAVIPESIELEMLVTMHRLEGICKQGFRIHRFLDEVKPRENNRPFFGE